MKLIVKFMRALMNNDDFKCLGIYVFFAAFVVCPWLSISEKRPLDIAAQGIPTNWVLLFCFLIEIVFSILMIFSIKDNRKKRVVKVLFQYTFVFLILIPFAIEIMEGMHKYANAFMVHNCREHAWACYPSNFVAMNYRQIFHWIASILPIVLLFTYDFIYLVLFRKFENYDARMKIKEKEIDAIKWDVLRLNYELEHEKASSAIYRLFLENNDDFKNYLINGGFSARPADNAYYPTYGFRFVINQPSIDLFRLNKQPNTNMYELCNDFFSHLKSDIVQSLEKFLMEVEEAFENPYYCGIPGVEHKSIKRSGSPLLLTEKICSIPKWDDDSFLSKYSECRLVKINGRYDVRNLGCFHILFYGYADECKNGFDEDKTGFKSQVKYVIITFDDFKKEIFSHRAYLLYRIGDDDVIIVRFASYLKYILSWDRCFRGMDEINEFIEKEKKDIWKKMEAKNSLANNCLQNER